MWKWRKEREGTILRLFVVKNVVHMLDQNGNNSLRCTAQFNPLQGTDLTCFADDPFGVRLRKTPGQKLQECARSYRAR